MIKHTNTVIHRQIRDSCRGTFLMDEMERFKTNNLHPGIPYRTKLKALINVYLQRSFFKSLMNQLEKDKRLSFKQLNAIDFAFNRLIKEKTQINLRKEIK